VKPTSSL